MKPVGSEVAEDASGSGVERRAFRESHVHEGQPGTITRISVECFERLVWLVLSLVGD